MRTVIPFDPYLEHFYGYTEIVEDDSSLFHHDLTAPVPSTCINAIDKGDESNSMTDGSWDLSNAPPTDNRTKTVEHLLDNDSRQANGTGRLFSSPV